MRYIYQPQWSLESRTKMRLGFGRAARHF